jgi:predicted nuclease with TOPRIM domain
MKVKVNDQELIEKIKELETKYSLLLDRLNATNTRVDRLCERVNELKKLYAIVEQLKLEVKELKEKVEGKGQYITISKKELKHLIAKYIAEKILGKG